MRWIGSQPAQDNHLDHLEKALTRAAARATALIEQSRREVERARVLLNDERGEPMALRGPFDPTHFTIQESFPSGKLVMPPF